MHDAGSMTPQHPPRTDHWPQALRSAAMRSGTLVRCGPGLRPVSWPEIPGTRCAAIAEHFSERLAAAEDTAAWIWGARRSPGEPLAFVTIGGRLPLGAAGSARRVREYRLEASDLVQIGAYSVTSRLRTAYDLLRSPAPFTAEQRAACRLLLVRTSDGKELLAERAMRTNRAEGSRVLRRLTSCYGSQES